MAPADDKTISVLLMELMKFLRAFGIQFDSEQLAVAYNTYLPDAIPGCLLPLAFKRMISSWKWKHPPMPADFLALVGDELSKLKEPLWKLQRLEMYAKWKEDDERRMRK